MSINKENLKKILTPLIKECVKEALSDKDLMQEVILSSGVLSTVVKEVAVGLNESRPQQPTFQSIPSGPSSAVMEARRMREQTRDEFQQLPLVRKPKPQTELGKVAESIDRDYSAQRKNYGALAGSDPGDEGISLSSFGLGPSKPQTPKTQKELSGVDLSDLNIGSRIR